LQSSGTASRSARKRERFPYSDTGEGTITCAAHSFPCLPAAARGGGTLARGILSGTGTPDCGLAGKSARAPVRTSAEWETVIYSFKTGMRLSLRAPDYFVRFLREAAVIM